MIRKKIEYDAEEDYLLDIGILANTTKESLFTLGYEDYKAIASSGHSMNLLPWNLSSKSSFTFYGAIDGKYICGNRVLGDTVLLSNRKILLEAVRSDSLLVKEIGGFVTSNGINELSPAVYVHSLQSGESVKLQDIMHNKYVFIDFWGSWCAPCIHSIPLVKRLYEKVKNRSDVLVVGIASEKNSDLSKLTKIIADLDLSYKNFVVYYPEMKLMNSPHTFWAVNSFPTYLLLDKSGKEIQRRNDSRKTEEVIALFLELIKGDITP